MKALVITLIVIFSLILLYFMYCLIVVFIANKKVFGVRGVDPDNPCYLRFEDYESWLRRTPYQTGYYGKAINGYLYEEKGRTQFKGFILLAHGFFGSHVQYLVDIAFLCQNGYQVLAFDQYGVGISDGENQVSLASGIYVLENVIRDVEKRNLNGNLPIYLYGHSWGAYSSLGALKTHPEIQGAVLRSGPLSEMKAYGHLATLWMKPLFYSVLPFARFSYFCLMGRRNMISAKRGLKNKKTPLLVIQSMEDPMVPYPISIAAYFKKHPRENVTLCITEKGGHNTLLEDVATENYQRLVKEYQAIVSSDLSETEKTRKKEEFISHLDRVHQYPYREEVCEEVLNFLNQTR